MAPGEAAPPRGAPGRARPRARGAGGAEGCPRGWGDGLPQGVLEDVIRRLTAVGDQSAARLVCRAWRRAAESAGGLIVDACSSVERLQKEWSRACLQGAPWRSEICEAAAFCGRVAVVDWARKNGCPWDEWTFSRAARGVSWR